MQAQPPPFKWTGKRRQAVPMLARGDAIEDVARALTVNQATLWRWRQHPEFARAVESEVERIAAAIRAEGIAHRQNRIDAYNQDWQKLQQVIEARAAYYAEEDVPGGETGLIVGRPVLVRVVDGDKDDPRYREVMEYRVDPAVLDGRLKLAKQAAIELGQWEEKVLQEQTGAVSVVYELELPPRGNPDPAT